MKLVIDNTLAIVLTDRSLVIEVTDILGETVTTDAKGKVIARSLSVNDGTQRQQVIIRLPQ